MMKLSILLNGDGQWQDLAERDVIHLSSGSDMQVAVLRDGMASGKPSVALRIDLPDGRVVVAETSARLFCAAARTIQGAFPDLFEDKPEARRH